MTAKKPETRQPGLQIDGGKRRDLNKERVAERMAGVPAQGPTPEQTAARRKSMAKRERVERQAAAIGHEGARLSRVRVKLSSNRTAYQTVRS